MMKSKSYPKDKEYSAEELKGVITDWDNELPTLIYHGVSQNCEIP